MGAEKRWGSSILKEPELFGEEWTNNVALAENKK